MSDQMQHAKRFRPLMPRPTPSTRDAMFSSTPDHYFINFCSSRPGNFSAWNFHSSDARFNQENETELMSNNNREALIASPRWNPMREQIEALEEMYKTGLRTPSAQQIQKIAANLRKFGKIEGKNVFYWFQNHKARERQKRRRLLDVNNHPQLEEKNEINIGTNLALKEPVVIEKVMDVEPGEKWSAYSHCRSVTKDSVSLNRAVMAESRRNGWEKELQQEQTRQSKRIKKATLQMDMFPCPNYIFSTRITTQQSPKQSCDHIHSNEEKFANRQNQILELFPLGRNNQSDIVAKEEESQTLPSNYATISPRQFFEFLPLKG